MLFDHHIHSKYSEKDSLSEIDDIIRKAQESGLGAIAISDHNAMKGSLLASKKKVKDLIIIPSIEISTKDGHVIGLGVDEIIPQGLSAKETVGLIHKAGGIAIAAHPYDAIRSGIGDLCWKLAFDAIELNGHCLHGNGKAREMAKVHSRPLVGGSDAHAIAGIGAVCTEVEGSTAGEIMGNIRSGKCCPVIRRSGIELKGAILADKISRNYQLLAHRL